MRWLKLIASEGESDERGVNYKRVKTEEYKRFPNYRGTRGSDVCVCCQGVKAKGRGVQGREKQP